MVALLTRVAPARAQPAPPLPPAGLDLPAAMLDSELLVVMLDLARVTPERRALAALSILGVRDEELAQLLRSLDAFFGDDLLEQRRLAGVRELAYGFGGGGGLHAAMRFDSAEAAEAYAAIRAGGDPLDGLIGQPVPRGRWVLRQAVQPPVGPVDPVASQSARSAMDSAMAAHAGDVLIVETGCHPLRGEPRPAVCTTSITLGPVPSVRVAVTMPDAACAAMLLEQEFADASNWRAQWPRRPSVVPAGAGEFSAMLRTMVRSLDLQQDGAEVNAYLEGRTIAADAAARYDAKRQMDVLLRAVARYCDEHDGRFPDRLEDLVTVRSPPDVVSDDGGFPFNLGRFLLWKTRNPRTGAEPGFVYRRPAAATLPSLKDPSRTPILFEATPIGGIDADGAIGFADWVVRPVPRSGERRRAAVAAAERAAADAAAARRLAAQQINAAADKLEAQANAARRAGRYREALALYERHLAEFPGARRSGDVANRLKEMRASNVIRAALKHEQADTECRQWLNLAANYARADRPDKARPLLQRVIERHAESAWAREAQARLSELR